MTATTEETEMTTNLTPKEAALLKGIATCDFMGDHGGPTADAPVYSFSATDAAEGIDAASAGGIMASLTKKGLVGGQHCRGEEPLVWLTEKGLAVYQALSGAPIEPAPGGSVDIRIGDERPMSLREEEKAPGRGPAIEQLLDAIDEVADMARAIEQGSHTHRGSEAANATARILRMAHEMAQRLLVHEDRPEEPTR